MVNKLLKMGLKYGSTVNTMSAAVNDQTLLVKAAGRLLKVLMNELLRT